MNSFPLSWSHYVRLLSVKDKEARKFYENEALRNGGMDMIEYHYDTSFAKYYYFDGAQKPVLHLRDHYGTCNVIVF